VSRSASRSFSGSRSRSRSWSSEGSRSPSPQRRRGGTKDKYEQSFRSNDKYNRQTSQHKPRGDYAPRHFSGGNKEEQHQRYEELERQRLKERERRDREQVPGREGREGRDHAPREKEYVPSKRRREDREMDGRDQMNDRGNEMSRQRRDDRKDSKSSSTRDHNKDTSSRTANSTDVGNRVLISSLPPSMSERKLKQLMQSVGEVENLKLSTTRHKALVAFTRSSTAVACRKKFHKYIIDDCKLLVEFA